MKTQDAGAVQPRHHRFRQRTAGARLLTGLTAVTVTAAGCGFVNTGDEEGNDASDGTLSLYVNTEQATGLSDLYEDFENETGIEVDASSAETDELNQQLRVQITSGTAADIIRVSPGYSSPVAVGPLGTEGELADIADGEWTDAIPEDTQELAQSEGEVVAYPLGRNALVMAYNKQAFADAGVEPPTTWSELFSVSEALEANGTTPIAAGFAEGITLQFWMYTLASTLVYAEDPDVDERMRAGEDSFVENEAWNQVFEKFLELRDAGHLPADALGVPMEQSMQAVATGDAAMTLTASAALPELYGYAEGGADDFGVFAVPATENAADTHVPTAPDFIAVNASSSNQEAAQQFIEFLSQEENVLAYADAVSTMPGLDVETDELDPILDPIQPMLEEDRTTPYANYVWPNGDVQQTLLNSGQELFDDSISTTELLEQMDEDYAKGTP